MLCGTAFYHNDCRVNCRIHYDGAKFHRRCTSFRISELKQLLKRLPNGPEIDLSTTFNIYNMTRGKDGNRNELVRARVHTVCMHVRKICIAIFGIVIQAATKTLVPIFITYAADPLI